MVQWVILGKLQYWIWNPHRISKIKRKKFKSVHKQGNWTFVVQWGIWGKVQYRIWNPHRIPKLKKKSFKSDHKQGNWNFVVQRVIWGKVQYRIWNPHQISKSKKKIIKNSVQKQQNYALKENAKIAMFKIDVRTSGIVYRVASLYCYRNNPWKFEVDRSILTCWN